MKLKILLLWKWKVTDNVKFIVRNKEAKEKKVLSLKMDAKQK